MKIINEKLITDVYGKWPSFHDTEIHEILLRRNLEKDNIPELIMTVHLFETTNEVDLRGYCRQIKHNLVQIGFENIDALELYDFNNQNVIMSLDIKEVEGKDIMGEDSYHYQINIPTSYGASLSFRCGKIIIHSIEPMRMDKE